MYHAIVFFPPLGFLIAGLFGRYIGARACAFIPPSFLAFTGLLASTRSAPSR